MDRQSNFGINGSDCHSCMRLQAADVLAPVVRGLHSMALDDLTAMIGGGSGQSFTGLTTTASKQGAQTAISTSLTNADAMSTQPVVETYIYSVDGRLVNILSQRPNIPANKSQSLQQSADLLPGQYKAVTAIHTANRLALATTAISLEIPAPKVMLDMSLDKYQVTLGQAIRATIAVTNTDAVSETGYLAISLGLMMGRCHRAGWRTWHQAKAD